ncbi:MAG: VOC family protein [Phycisphaeraceae bacterium]|nr:VOC family protein [Phycisphaerales bacterium]MCB9859446.1 VOC family protein [Phycisphaeraceae bacterium]
MHVKAITPILNVSDVPASIQWFEKLGWHRGFTWNEGGMMDASALRNEHGDAGFAGMCANTAAEGTGPQIFLCRDEQGKRDPDTTPDPNREDYGAVWMSWWIDDVDAAHAECVTNGIEIVRAPANMPWHVRECLIRHPDGHCFRISGPVK